MKEYISSALALLVAAVFLVLAGASLFFAKPAKIALAEGAMSVAPQTYTSSELGYSITYPAGFTADPLYSYNPSGPEEAVSGVSFTIPPSLASSANLSSDSFISVESSPDSGCTLKTFFGDAVLSSTQSVTDGVRYEMGQSRNPKTKQLYMEYVYLHKGTPCIAVRYFIHSASSATANVNAAIAAFDSVRHSLSFTR